LPEPQADFPSTAETGYRFPRRTILLLTVSLTGAFIGFNTGMVAVALPEIRREFDVGLAFASWVISGYLVAFVVLQPVGGRLGDNFGRGRIFFLGIAISMVASLSAAFAWSVPSLIFLRIGQAAGWAFLVPNGYAMLREAYPAAGRGRAFGWTSLVAIVFSGIGPVVGGAVVELDWRGLFFVTVGNLTILTVLAFLSVPRWKPQRQRGEPVDYLGVALLAGVILSIAVTTTLIADGFVALIGVVAVLIFVAALVFWERRFAVPIIRLSLFRIRTFTAGSTGALLSQMMIYTAVVITPLYLAEVSSLSSLGIGLLLGGMLIPSGFVSFGGGWLADRFGRRMPITLGGLAGTVTLGALVSFGLDSGVAVYALMIGLFGLGFGILHAPLQTAVMEATPTQIAANASGVFQMSRHLGATVGAALVGGIVGSGIGGSAIGDFRVVFGIMAGAGVVLTLSSFGIHHWPSTQPD
jgi:MFS family permease